MSRLAKKPIILPESASVSIDSTYLNISLQTGDITYKLHSGIKAELKKNELYILNDLESKKERALLGTLHSLVKSAVKGSVTPFVTSLEIIGVGYKAELVDGKMLLLSLGYSHDIFMPIPDDINVTCEKPTLIHVSSVNKESLGRFVAKIQSLRKKDPYKGKGIYKTTEYKRRKKGKNK